MKKFLISFSLTLIISLINVSPIMAQGIDIRIPCPSVTCDSQGLAELVAGIVPVITSILTGGLVVVNGVVLMTSAGDSEKIGKAKSAMIASGIGFLISMLGPIVYSSTVAIFTGQGSGLFSAN